MLQAWGQETRAEETLRCDSLEALGLACEADQGRWSDLRHFDRPAALRIQLTNGGEGEVVLLGLDDEFARLAVGPERPPVTWPIVELDQLWSGDYLLLWRPPPGGERVINRGASPESVHWLRERLRAWPGGDPDLANLDVYDDQVMDLVQAFQSEHQLKVDGIAGPHTLILLANALDNIRKPESPR
jgi:general secretion pathway protein A